MDDGAPPPEEDFTSLPISERLAHKNWKARVSGYETLSKSFQQSTSDTDPVFRPYINNADLLKKIATDANAVAQEKGVECLVALIKYSGETSAKTRETVVPALVDKCLGSTRAGTRSNAIEVILQYVEVENSGAGVVADLLPGLAAKQPKTVAGCVQALKEIIRNFGIQVTPPPPVLKALPKIFAHTDKNVRADGTNLAHVLYQYIGAAIEPWLADLKPVQVKELKEAFEAMDKDGKGKGTLKQDRLTRKQAIEAESRVDEEPDAQANGGESNEPEVLDPRASAEPQDITPKMPANFKGNLTSSKWKDRKEALDELLTVLTNTLRIKDNADIGELARSIAVCIQKDANVACVMTASSCMEALAKGVMEPFGRYHEAVIVPMLERLKERKASVTDAIGQALDAIFMTSNLGDIIPDLLPAMNSKNPQVKEGTLKFLSRSFATATTPIPPAQLKSVSEPLATLLDDGHEGARNEAANCLGTLMKMVGERPLNPIMSNLADVRKAKVTEAFEKATVKCKAGAKAPPPKSAPAAPAPKSTAKVPGGTLKKEDVPSNEEVPKKPLVKPPARLLQAKGTASGTNASTPNAPASTTAGPPVKKLALVAPAKSSTKAAPAVAPGALDAFKYKHSPEDADALAADMIPSNFLTDLGDANWKTRLAVLEEMTTWVDANANTLNAEVLIRTLAKKGWNEKNFQVSAKLYNILTLLAEKCPSFGRSCVALCVAHLTDKLGDMKLKKPAGETLTVFAEKTSLQLVLGQAYEPLAKQKAPKAIADAITWIDAALQDFGIAGLSLRALIESLKNGLKNSNAGVRTNATKAMVTVKLFAGSSIKDFLEDLNPQLRTTIETEFDKVEGNPPPTPTRTSVDLAGMANSAGASGGKGGGSDPLDDLYPRVEIDSLLKGTTILNDAKSDAWKTKKDALETLQALLDQGANKRLKPSMGEIGQILKARVTDSNKPVQLLALDIVARVATGMGKPFEKQSRFFVLPVATVLADQKANIRTAALHTLTAIASASEGLESLIPGLTTAMESANPMQKQSLLQWIATWFAEQGCPPNLDLNGWASPLVACLDDRSADVRKAAQSVLPNVILCAGYDYVMQQTSSLKPASRSTAIPIIQAARATLPQKTSTETQPAVAKAPPKVISKQVDSPPHAPLEEIPSNVPTKPLGVRRKLPIGTSRPESRTGLTQNESHGAGAKAAPNQRRPESVQLDNIPKLAFISTADKKGRLGKDAARWINEAGPTRKDLLDSLQHQMESTASKDLFAQLFSTDHSAINDHIAGLNTIVDFYAHQSRTSEFATSVALANFDLPLKYISMKAHEPQSNIVAKCLDVVDAVLGFLVSVKYQLTDPEAICFAPTLVFKLGDAREPVRARVQQIVQMLPKVYAYSRVFQLLLEHGLKSKVAKTRQGTLDELAGLLKRFGMGACEPTKAFPVLASMISDKDSLVRKSALNAIGEGFSLVGEKVWSFVGPLNPKDKTQLEEKLRRMEGPASSEAATVPAQPVQVSRLAGPSTIPRPGSPLAGGIGRAASGSSRPPSAALSAASRLARPASPAQAIRPNSPSKSNLPAGSSIPAPASPTTTSRPKSLLPSRLGQAKPRLPAPSSIASSLSSGSTLAAKQTSRPPSHPVESVPDEPQIPAEVEDAHDITIIISSILSSDASRSVDALKKIQKILTSKSEDADESLEYRLLSEHAEGLIETVTLQVSHVFDKQSEIVKDENFRLAKHLIQTLNNFCDHALLAESLTVEILTALLEELTLRLLETDESTVTKVKDLSRFINMIILRLFATARRMSIFRSLFTLLLSIVKPFPSNQTPADSKEAKVAELVLKCIWKLARNIPQDLKENKIDPIELFPAIEYFLQSIPPNEWRARATNGVPCGDMPLRTIKVIIQHVVAHHGEDVYDMLSSSFDDPSATIVYPYVYRILNSNANARAAEKASTNGSIKHQYSESRDQSPPLSRPESPLDSGSRSSYPQRISSPAQNGGVSQRASGNIISTDENIDSYLTEIMGHISSEKSSSLHKDGLDELYKFTKDYPDKAAKVERILESTGSAFQKYINRMLANRAAEDSERTDNQAETLNILESRPPHSPTRSEQAYRTHSPRSSRQGIMSELGNNEKLSRLHDIFQYRSSVASNGSSQGAGRNAS